MSSFKFGSGGRERCGLNKGTKETDLVWGKQVGGRDMGWKQGIPFIRQHFFNSDWARLYTQARNKDKRTFEKATRTGTRRKMGLVTQNLCVGGTEGNGEAPNNEGLWKHGWAGGWRPGSEGPWSDVEGLRMRPGVTDTWIAMAVQPQSGHKTQTSNFISKVSFLNSVS